MAIISKKKKIFQISDRLRVYLGKYDREIDLPIYYSDLLRYENSIPLYDKEGNDTFWETVFFHQADMGQIYDSLKNVYAILKASGDLSVMEHLNIDRVDLCIYGNTQPFRIRVVNQINDNFDF